MEGQQQEGSMGACRGWCLVLHTSLRGGRILNARHRSLLGALVTGQGEAEHATRRIISTSHMAGCHSHMAGCH